MMDNFDQAPKNVPLEQITVPTSLHYTTNDEIADLVDVNRLIPMLNGTKDLYLHQIDNFNHADFIISVHCSRLRSILSTNSLVFFRNIQRKQRDKEIESIILRLNL